MTSNPAERILVIAVDPHTTFLLEQILHSAGYDVVTTREPDTAELLVKTTSPRLIILNDNLADASDLERAGNLINHFPAIPLLLLTSHDSPEVLKNVIRLGVADYLCLPLHPEDILNVVQNCLGQSQKRKDWVNGETQRVTLDLQRQVDELEILSRFSRSLNSSWI